MRFGAGLTGAIAAALAGGGSAFAQDIGYHSGAINMALHGAVSEQVGSVSGVDRFPGTPPANLDGYGRLVADWTSPQGWLLGANLETSTRRTTEALGSGEAYVYFSSGLGRVEVGKDYGPANSLAFHAPEIALGQIRGDFARYAGTQALLSAFDTATEPKIVYLSPPTNGFRFGVSWAPSDRSNVGAENPADRTLQHDGVELGAQYQRPVGDWVLGASAGYVHARAAAITQRQDIDSWSAGFEARRGPLKLGVGYVDRGDSNLLVTGFRQREVNTGAAWTMERWGLAASASDTDGVRYFNRLAAIGGYFNLTAHVTARADLVSFDEHDGSLPRRKGVTAVSELEYHF
jgi:hypothetical protein